MTKRDLLEDNADLLAAAIELLRRLPERASWRPLVSARRSSVEPGVTPTGI